MTPNRTGERGGGLVQVILVLLIAGIVTLFALRMFQKSELPQVSPGGGHPARAVMDHVALHIEGLESPADAAQAEEALRKAPGVASVSIDSDGTAHVTYNPAQTNPDQLVAAVQRAGYRARR
jgi:copper chaperone CopZ